MGTHSSKTAFNMMSADLKRGRAFPDSASAIHNAKLLPLSTYSGASSHQVDNRIINHLATKEVILLHHTLKHQLITSSS
jgi:hypothetical protein